MGCLSSPLVLTPRVGRQKQLDTKQLDTTIRMRRAKIVKADHFSRKTKQLHCELLKAAAMTPTAAALTTTGGKEALAARSALYAQRLQALLQELWLALRDAPAPGSTPLAIAGRRCGWLAPRAQAALTALATVHGDGVALGQGLAPGPELNACLQQVACLLRAAGALSGWRDELLDVLDSAEKPSVLGAIERAAARPLGLLTQAVHLNASTPDGRIWIARRAPSKAVDPGLWDTLAGGLVSHGETPAIALLRESLEEAGLTEAVLATRSPLRHLGRISRRVPEGYLVQNVLACHAVLEADVRPVNHDGEVMAFRAVTPAELCDMICARAFTREATLVLLNDLLAGNTAGNP